MTVEPLLLLERVDAGYGELIILHDISLALDADELICVIGRNGMGKTTLLSTIMGIAHQFSGTIAFQTNPITSKRIVDRSRLGIGLVPQEREVFPTLTVSENLLVSQQGKTWSLERCFDLFPRLAERKDHLGSQLSGGEQQMLSISRALMTEPTLLLLDEPSEGLAPVIVDEVFEGLTRLRKERDLAIILVEQHVGRVMHFAPRTVALVNGRIVYDGPSDALRDDADQLDAIVGLAV